MWKVLVCNHAKHHIVLFLVVGTRISDAVGDGPGDGMVTGINGSGWLRSSMQGSGIGSKLGIIVGGIC